MGEMKTYEAVYDENTAGVFGISLVENPATEEHFITLSEDEKVIKLSTIDEEQRILLGLVLEPNTPIYRNQGGEEFNLIFNNETVKSLAHGFLKNGHQKNSTIEHDNDRIEGVTFVESWLVDDPKHDKSNAYDREYQKGSWLVSMKVDSDEIWNDYVKTGKVQGFSIDAVVKLREVNNKKVEMKLSERVSKIASDFAVKLGLEDKPKEEVQETKEEIKMGSAMVEDGSIMFEWEGEMPEAGAAVFAVDKSEPDVKIPVPEGKYPLEDGTVIVVAEEGIISEVVAPEAKEEEKTEVVEEEEAPKAPVSEESSSIANDIKSILIKYEESEKRQLEMAEQLTTLLGMKDELENVKKEVVEMGEQPIKKPTAPTVQLNAQGRLLEKLRANK